MSWINAAATASVLLVVTLLQRVRARRTLYVRSPSPRVAEAIARALINLRCGYRSTTTDNTNSRRRIDLEWTNSKSTKPAGDGTWNRLCGGAKCLEDKRILGLVLNSVPGTLRTFSLSAATTADLDLFWEYAQRELVPQGKRYWVLKDSRANGAAGVWILDLLAADDKRDYARAAEILYNGGSEAGFCLQEYCPGPLLLWRGRKFHLRVTAVVLANGRVFVHRLGFLHPANKPYDANNVMDAQVQLTNLCANMHAAGSTTDDDFVGEVCVDLPTEFPDLWPKLLHVWRTTVDAAFAVGMRHQRHGGDNPAVDFEYVGLDVMANERGEVFLLEINSPPALYSATRQPRADAQHCTMLGDLYQYLVLPTMLGLPEEETLGGYTETATTAMATIEVQRWDGWHAAQAKCDLLLMRFLFRQRKLQDQLFGV